MAESNKRDADRFNRIALQFNDIGRGGSGKRFSGSLAGGGVG
jgi:hypothetical protein